MPVTPLEWAEKEFARIESSARIESGDGEWVAIEAANVLRGYLARAMPELRLSLTTRELAGVGVGIAREQRTAAVELLEKADLLKFARGSTTPDAARALLDSSRTTVREIDAVLRDAERSDAEAKAA